MWRKDIFDHFDKNLYLNIIFTITLINLYISRIIYVIVSDFLISLYMLHFSVRHS